MRNNSYESGLKRFCESLSQTAKLRLEILAYENDQIYVKNGGKIFYCIDSNIIHFFLGNDKNYDNKESNGYGMLFSVADKQISDILEKALTRYILFLLAKDVRSQIPLIVLPGHGEEIRRLYDRVSFEAMSSLSEDMDFEERRKEIKRLISEATKPGSEGGNVDAIFELIYNSYVDIERLNRYNQIITKGCIGRLTNLRSGISESIIGTGKIDEAEISKVLGAVNAPATVHELFEESSYRLQWEDRLKDAKPDKGIQRIRTDAVALARMELINRRLELVHAKLVLITGDLAMHRAGSDYFADNQGANFSEKYIRHPKAFLASHHVIARPEGISLSGEQLHLEGRHFVNNWIDALLARFTNSFGPQREDLQKISKLTSENFAELNISKSELENFEQALVPSWNAFSQQLRIQHITSSETARLEIERFWSEKEFAQAQDRLIEFDREQIRSSQTDWQNFLDASTHVGYRMVMHDAEIMWRKRTPPITYYELFPRTNEFVILAIKNSAEGDLRGELRKMLHSIDEEEPFGYAKMLAYATLHAFHGNWYVAGILADRAIRISASLQNGEMPIEVKGLSEAKLLRRREIGPKISGREAFYFSAVAKRVIARSESELEVARLLLDRAESALDSENYPIDNIDVKRARFLRERVAIDIHSYLFEFFDRENGHKKKDKDFNWKKLIRRLENCIDVEDLSEDKWILKTIKISAILNVFMIQAVGGEMYIKPPFDQRFYSLKCEELFRITGFQDAKNIRSFSIPLVVIGIYAGVHFLTLTASLRRFFRNEIIFIKEQLSGNPKSMEVMPYDAKRYRYLLNLAEKKL